MIAGNDDDDNNTNESIEPTGTMLPQGHYLRRNPWFYHTQQIADQEAYELIHPVPCKDHNDGEDIRSRDSIDQPTP